MVDGCSVDKDSRRSAIASSTWRLSTFVDTQAVGLRRVTVLCAHSSAKVECHGEPISIDRLAPS